MAIYQTIHHPPEGESLIGRHLTAPECPCHPDMTTAHQRKPEYPAYAVVAHYWHHKLEEKNVTDEKSINAAVAAEFDRIAKDTGELKADLLQVIQTALEAARYRQETPKHIHNNPKALNLDLVDGELLVEWTDDGERSERFAIKLEPLL